MRNQIHCRIISEITCILFIFSVDYQVKQKVFRVKNWNLIFWNTCLNSIAHTMDSKNRAYIFMNYFNNYLKTYVLFLKRNISLETFLLHTQNLCLITGAWSSILISLLNLKISWLRNDIVRFWFWGYRGEIKTELPAPVVWLGKKWWFSLLGLYTFISTSL